MNNKVYLAIKVLLFIANYDRELRMRANIRIKNNRVYLLFISIYFSYFELRVRD